MDAGKSTLMGRMLLAFGEMSDREHQQNERASAKLGKGSFAYAWALDSSAEERERGVTIDVAQDSFRTAHRSFHLLDAPGHRDFVPNMISGAAQADAAVLVIDAALGAFEAGFGPLGQTREHATLIRSLGVQQLIVVVNKLDAVEYDAERYNTIKAQLEPFLTQTGFDLGRSVTFLPCAAASGENVAERAADGRLATWYSGPTLAEALDTLVPPQRAYTAPLRIPVTNVFKGQTAVSSGLGVSGRVVSGIVQLGEAVQPVPGDEYGVVRAIEMDREVPNWAAAGANVTLYLGNIEANQITVGSVLCSPASPIPLCASALVQVLVFQPTYPLVKGAAVELFHHSTDIPAQLVELVALLDKGSGEVIKRNPRVLPHNATALVRVNLRHPASRAGGGGYPLEDFKSNKEMARLLFRMGGESVAAGIVMEVSPEPVV